MCVCVCVCVCVSLKLKLSFSIGRGNGNRNKLTRALLIVMSCLVHKHHIAFMSTEVIVKVNIVCILHHRIYINIDTLKHLIC